LDFNLTGVVEYFIVVVSMRYTKQNARNYYIDAVQAEVTETVTSYESIENKIYQILGADIGQISPANLIVPRLTRGNPIVDPDEAILPVSYQMFSFRGKYTDTMDDFSHLSGTDTQFFLKSVNQRIEKARYVLNSEENGIGSLGNTSVVINNGGTVFVTEVALGAVSGSGDYSVNYLTGQVTTFDPVSSYPANLEIDWSGASEGAIALQYSDTGQSNWKNYGIPVVSTFTDMTQYQFFWDIFTRSDLGLFEDEKKRPAYLILYVWVESEDPDIPSDYKNHVILNFVRIMNAFEPKYEDYVIGKNSSATLNADFIPAQESPPKLNADIAQMIPPYNKLNADIVQIKQEVKYEIDFITTLQGLPLNIDFIETKVLPNKIHYDILPTIVVKSDMEIDSGYDFDKIAGKKELAVSGRKKEG
jgi:hypothetical protein